MYVFQLKFGEATPWTNVLEFDKLEKAIRYGENLSVKLSEDLTYWYQISEALGIPFPKEEKFQVHMQVIKKGA